MKTLFLALLFALPAAAQTPANTVKIGSEGITITATTGTNVAYQFGAGTKLNTIPSLPLPALITCATNQPQACANLGGDPDSGVSKSIYAVQQATVYTVTYTAAGSSTPVVVTVSALPAAPVKEWSCTGKIIYSLLSDGTFLMTNSGALNCTETL